MEGGATPREPLRLSPARIGILVFLASISLFVYAQTASHPFVSFDDGLYVTENPVVKRGLTAEGAAWAFTTTHASNWHPLAWISHMADVELFGLDAGAHHLVNVLLHILDTILLFLLLDRTTGARWRSAFVAALFAVHPLHVESVAWVAERKDLLSALFFFLALGAYGRYAASPGALRMAAVAALFALALMAKPSVVTFPFELK